MDKNLILAILGGAAAGAIAGLLLAPKKGTETRAEIIDFLKEKCPFIHKTRLQEIADEIEAEIGK